MKRTEGPYSAQEQPVLSVVGCEGVVIAHLTAVSDKDGDGEEEIGNAYLLAASYDGLTFAEAFLAHIARSDLDDLDFGRSLQSSGLIERAKAFVAKTVPA